MRKREKIDLEKPNFVNCYNNGEIPLDEFVKKVLEIKRLNKSFMGLEFIEAALDDETVLIDICNTNGIVLDPKKKNVILCLVKGEVEYES